MNWFTQERTSIVVVLLLVAFIPAVLAALAVHRREKRKLSAVPGQDLPDPTPEEAKSLGLREALVQRLARLFLRVDRRKGDIELYDPLSTEEAIAETDTIFGEFADIFLEGWDAGIFKVRGHPAYLLTDDWYGQLYLEDGDRARFVDFLYDRMRVCGVDKKFLGDVYEAYCMSDDEADAPDHEG